MFVQKDTVLLKATVVLASTSCCKCSKRSPPIVMPYRYWTIFFKKNNYKVDGAVFDFDAIEHTVKGWIQEYKTYEYPVLNSKEVDSFWILEEEQIIYYNQLRRQHDYDNDLHNLHVATRSSVSRKRKEKARVDRFNHNVVEGDGLFFFKCRSVASTLKPLFSRYQSLTAENQALRGYSSNGILDLTNQKESGRKLFFSKDQWS